FSLDTQGEALILTLHNGFVETRSQSDPRTLRDLGVGTFVDWQLRLPVENLLSAAAPVQTELRRQRLSDMALPDLLTLRGLYARELADSATPAATKAKDNVERTRVSYYISRNFAFAYSSLALVVLAIPLGIKASRTETYAN